MISPRTTSRSIMLWKSSACGTLEKFCADLALLESLSLSSPLIASPLTSLNSLVVPPFSSSVVGGCCLRKRLRPQHTTDIIHSKSSAIWDEVTSWWPHWWGSYGARSNIFLAVIPELSRWRGHQERHLVKWVNHWFTLSSHMGTEWRHPLGILWHRWWKNGQIHYACAIWYYKSALANQTCTQCSNHI